MFRLVERRGLYYAFSSLLILVGVATLIYSSATIGAPLQLGIDFTGGTIFDIQFSEASVTETQLREFFNANGFEELVIQELTPLDEENAATFPPGSRWSIRTEEASSEQVSLMLEALAAEFGALDADGTSTSEVSGTVGREVTTAAIFATLATTFVIMAFVWFAFRKVPHAFRYGACAIIAMFHDLLVMVSAMSIMGLVLGWQADALFLTALLTVLGFSVQDPIVVFDRIRENIQRRREESFELIVNRSVLETIHRSLATQLNAIFVMIAIALFGGETIRQFIIILLIGLTSGTYSSIFIAVPLLVSWEKGEIPLVNREAKRAEQQAVTA